jgi:hypothetical protein
MLTKDHIDELVTLRADARMAAENFSEAIANLAKEHDVPKGALRRYVCAKEKDALDKLIEESDALETMLGDSGE